MIGERELVPATAPGPHPGSGGSPPSGTPAHPAGTRPPALGRAFGAAALTSVAAGAMCGGVFGSSLARALAASSALFGCGWALLAVRAGRRGTLLQILVLPVAAFLGTLSLIPGSSDPSNLPQLVRDAVSAGRLLRPPAPFDPGWRPILVVVFTLLGFASAWVAVALRRPKLGLILPLPLLGLTAVSQPAEAEFMAGLLGIVPLLGALALVFGGDGGSATDLSATFELRRAVRGAVGLVLVVGAVVLVNRTDILFPEPVYNPAQKPQKPRPIPIGQARDRVLFEVQGELSGPWRTGVLDVFDGRAWRLPPYETSRFRALPRDGRVDAGRSGDLAVNITVRDLGDTATLPGVATPTRIANIRAPEEVDLVFDPRTDLFRVPRGRVPSGIAYELSLPAYPSADQLRGAGPLEDADPDQTFAPRPPARVAALIESAPADPWERLDLLRSRLNDVAVAAGTGVPVDVPPTKVEDLLFGSHEGSPFEIVAAEALLARWAGVPSRIGFGFDGLLEEDGKTVVRPKLASNWLEVGFEGFGWVPVIFSPKQAKATLDTDPDARFDPTIEPSEDIAAEIFIAVEIQDIRLLYQRIREAIVRALPWLAGLVALFAALPSMRRAARRRNRRRWAQSLGPRAQIAVEYAEFRDAATDLGTGHPYDTPLEYLDAVIEDTEHEELAWLITRTLYGDLSETVSEADARAAREMAGSLRRRMLRAQPWQARVLAALSRASLKQPYTLEVPSTWLSRRLRRTGPERTLVGARRS